MADLSNLETIEASSKPTADDFEYAYVETVNKAFVRIAKERLKEILGANRYTNEEIDQKFSTIPKFNIEVVSSLPTTDISETTIYLVSSGDYSENLYTEYININGLWEILGTQKSTFNGSAKDVTYDDSETKLGADNVQDAVGKLSEEIDNLVSTGGGLTTSEKSLMLSLFKAIAYNNPEMMATVEALEQKWFSSGGGDDSGEETTYYTITNNLTNVTTSNSTGAVEKDASYISTLTVDDGHEMESVTVTMGGVDITATAYANGVVTIGNVTGNVVITANATATQEARTVYFASDDSITKTQGAMNKTGTIGLTTNVRYKVATLPYSEGMKIHTYMMGSSINDYPPFILYDGTTYTIPEYETPEATTYEITLSGLSNPTVYVNMLGTTQGVFDDAKFYYITQ